MTEFLSQSNVKLLWDLISEQDIFTFLKPATQNTVLQMFLSGLQDFYRAEQRQLDLVSMNKKYIVMVLNYIKSITPIRKLNIDTNTNSNLIEYTTLTDEYTPKPPSKPQFQDATNNNEKMAPEQLESQLQFMQQQRQYEDAQIFDSQPTSSKREKKVSFSKNVARRVSDEGSRDQRNEESAIFLENEMSQSSEDDAFFSKLKPKVQPSWTLSDKSLETRLADLEHKFDILSSKIDRLINAATL